jgi:hypothetical protein
MVTAGAGCDVEAPSPVPDNRAEEPIEEEKMLL